MSINNESKKTEQEDSCFEFELGGVCKNCIYYVYDDSEEEYCCENDDVMNSIFYHGLYAYFVPDEDFCCNKFRRRENDN